MNHFGHIDLTLTARITNEAALDDLCEAIDLLTAAAEDLPWRDDLAEAAALLGTALDSLTLVKN